MGGRLGEHFRRDVVAEIERAQRIESMSGGIASKAQAIAGACLSPACRFAPNLPRGMLLQPFNLRISSASIQSARLRSLRSTIRHTSHRQMTQMTNQIVAPTTQLM
jgi:hypothetical protein